MEEENKQTVRCPYNKWVDCSDLKCASCGWHPDTAARRLQKIQAKLQREKGRGGNGRKM